MEQWEPVPGYKKLYEVSDMGRIRSLRNNKLLSTRGTGPGGRPRVCLYYKRNGKRHWKLLYRVVLETFRGPCPKGMEACHYPDRTVTNCRLINLHWGTHVENSAQMVEHGRVNPNRMKDGRFTSYEAAA